MSDNMKYIVTDPNLCPVDVRESIDRFATHGIKPGHFVTAILENDLLEAVNRADSRNVSFIPAIVSYMAERVPANARGSAAEVAAWLKGVANE